MDILVIEDDAKIAQALKKGLEAAGFAVEREATGPDGLGRLRARPFDLVVLDLMLPGRDGLDVLRDFRAGRARTPVLVLTARDALDDKVAGLDAGADDYLVKPFAFPELLARVRALLRRGAAEGRPAKLRLADLEMDPAERAVTRGGKPVALTAREFDLVEYLLRRAGQVVTRAMIARDIWEETQRATPLDNVIDVHIGRIRRKIDEPFAVKLLHTVRGVGFLMKESGR
jgi:two-component system copper resistance phosphate regulon response regulator CusR